MSSEQKISWALCLQFMLRAGQCTTASAQCTTLKNLVKKLAVMQQENLSLPTLDPPKVYTAFTVAPSDRHSTAKRVASAPPIEWPVRITCALGYRTRRKDCTQVLSWLRTASCMVPQILSTEQPAQYPQLTMLKSRSRMNCLASLGPRRATMMASSSLEQPAYPPASQTRLEQGPASQRLKAPQRVQFQNLMLLSDQQAMAAKPTRVLASAGSQDSPVAASRSIIINRPVHMIQLSPEEEEALCDEFNPVHSVQILAHSTVLLPDAAWTTLYRVVHFIQHSPDYATAAPVFLAAFGFLQDVKEETRLVWFSAVFKVVLQNYPEQLLEQMGGDKQLARQMQQCLAADAVAQAFFQLLKAPLREQLDKARLALLIYCFLPCDKLPLQNLTTGLLCLARDVYYDSTLSLSERFLLALPPQVLQTSIDDVENHSAALEFWVYVLRLLQRVTPFTVYSHLSRIYNLARQLGEDKVLPWLERRNPCSCLLLVHLFEALALVLGHRQNCKKMDPNRVVTVVFQYKDEYPQSSVLHLQQLQVLKRLLSEESARAKLLPQLKEQLAVAMMQAARGKRYGVYLDIGQKFTTDRSSFMIQLALSESCQEYDHPDWTYFKTHDLRRLFLDRVLAIQADTLSRHYQRPSVTKSVVSL